MSILEKEIEDWAVLYSETLNYMQFKLNAIGSMGKPDRLFISPQGTHIFVEFKRKGEPLRALQRYWAIQMTIRRCLVYRCDDKEHAKRILQNHLDPAAVPIEGVVHYDATRKRWTLSGSRIGENFYLLNGKKDTEGKGTSP